MVPKTYLLSFYQFQNQQYQGKQMKEQIKNINRLMQRSIFQHEDLLNHMGHWLQRCQQHQDCENDQD
jgi:hypothetical protein